MSQGATAVTLVPALVGLWLIGLSYGDLRTRHVPAWATALPLAVLGLLRTLVIPPDGAVVPGGVAVGFALLMLLLSDTPSAVFPAGAAAFCAGLSGEQAQVLVGSWIAELVLTDLNIWGAGDGKVLAVLTALYPDVRLVVAVGAALLVGSVVTLLRQRPHTGERRTFPAIPWLAVGTALYLALVALSGQLSAISFGLPAVSF
ncbi:MAG TPA: prepilin peptidase [Anaerolineae bacterium]|nr:prepilin peptidase [Anaerolineae bacterium]HQI86464.1 prepilin peptidase [Anaerolineae bacterium]